MAERDVVGPDVEEEEEEADPDDESEEDIVEHPESDDDDEHMQNEDSDSDNNPFANLAQFIMYVAQRQAARAGWEADENESTNTATSDDDDESISMTGDCLFSPELEHVLFARVALNTFLNGARCEVCDQEEYDGVDVKQQSVKGRKAKRAAKKRPTPEQRLKRCRECDVVFCDTCSIRNLDWSDSDMGKVTCAACIYKAVLKDKISNYQTPQCLLCSKPGGWLREAVARPMPEQEEYFKNHPQEMENTFFAKERPKLWCHPLCAFWYPKLEPDDKSEKVDISNVVSADGNGLIESSSSHCSLCGGKGGLKVKCIESACRGEDDKNPLQFHVTCAREAGLEVDFDDETYGPAGAFYVKCYQHGGLGFNLRSQIDAMLAIRKANHSSGKQKEATVNVDSIVTFAHATRLLHSAIRVMRTLGWAWRWAEWWVRYGCTNDAERPGAPRKQSGAKSQSTVTTQEGRCEVARRCRLAALGMALRNRAYDNVAGEGAGDYVYVDDETLDRALRSVLNETMLIGPRTKVEKDFLVEWLTRAYRSKSRLLGFGNDKIHVVAENGCVHQVDRSPKFELGDRPAPGRQVLKTGQISEACCKIEVDDFMLEPSKESCDLNDAPPLARCDLNGAPPLAQKESLPQKRKR